MSVEYFQRAEIIEKVWRRLANNEHLFIPGPRRIGKTSLLHHLRDNPQKGLFPIYVITEAADSLNEFYRKLHFHLTQDEVLGKLAKWSAKASELLKRHRIDEIGGKGVKLGSNEVDYLEEFKKLIRNLDLEGKIVLMVDEFPQTLENILEYKDEAEAKRLLQTQREMRIDPDIREKLLFVYAGSIGLENVVARINATKHINDLSNVIIPALTRGQGLEFLDILLIDRQLDASPEVKNYLLDAVEWLIPFYLRVIVDELTTTTVAPADVDAAINELLKCRNHFDHWHQRLRISLSKEEYLFAKALLNLASSPERPQISSAEITDLAVQYGVVSSQTEVLGTLKHDGYIDNLEHPQTYRFNSPIVRLWWWRNIAN